MIATALELYNTIRKFYREIPEQTFCELEALCENPLPLCAQKTLVINFDDIKDEYCRQARIDKLSSVDAIGLNRSKNIFCFIEVKSWSKFAEHTDNVNEAMISSQISRYDFQKKFDDSKAICINITGDNDIFKNIKTAFFIVSDISPKIQPLHALAESLSVLANTSSIWENEYNKQMESKASGIKPSDVDKYYISCKDLDSFLAAV